jgi:vacuolar-type H+-ATPase subunit E/Vma4
MGYRELLQALEEEVGRQIREGRTEAAQEERRILDATRAELQARRQTVLDEERRRLGEASARALSAARLEQDRALVVLMRRQLAELRQAAEAWLAKASDPELLPRLVDELVPELGDGPLVFRVRPGQEKDLAAICIAAPGLVARSTIEARPTSGRGGGLTRRAPAPHNTLGCGSTTWRLLSRRSPARCSGRRPNRSAAEASRAADGGEPRARSRWPAVTTRTRASAG